MVLDTSAIISILTREETADRLVAAVETDATRLISTATVVEAALVLLGRYGQAGEPQLDRFLRNIGADVVPVGEDQANLARDAALRFGRGRHAAGLNFGGLFSYALAVARDEPLLFVGDDFQHTDVRATQW